MKQSAWYQDAVIYQLHVRSFFDSNEDGVGDFVGLTQKLDYVASLGVSAIWLLPFYPSPLRDEGYDIADYTSINSAYGTLDDFRAFLEAAHARGLKVITELVINHTSDQHPWFQRARHAPPGSSERNYYVWSDTDQLYSGVRVIFRDFETSNWTWDKVAGQYFWHRFYSHQPDLNFDNPDVLNEVLRVLDFWLAMGVDGLRLDAVPYLIERDGTNCESLPETHAILRVLREHIDQHFPGRMLLAEANQWPDETAAYFGDGNECHMCFHFPLMPRLYLALQQENRFPIIDILKQTPLPPPGAQWAVFLRNHDELTLEMVSEEDRLFMYDSYAVDPHARINMGVRRRLAPLLRNDRRKLELLHSLLFAIGGTPVLYYGDEIQMGDNFYLRDRDSVRTPMQWSPDRNAGFSTANPQSLFLPPIIDPEFHFQTNNVETLETNPHAFLWWLRRVLRLRRQNPALSCGTTTFLTPSNPRILAFMRQIDEDVVLIVVNLSRLSQYVELDLSAFRGRTPRELFGQCQFPMVGELPYLLALGPYGFYWFRLEWPAGADERRDLSMLPEVRIQMHWRELLSPAGRHRLEAVLPSYLARQVWFPGGAARIRACSITQVVQLANPTTEDEPFLVLVVTTELSDGQTESYQLLLVVCGMARAELIVNDRPSAGLAKLVQDESSSPLFFCDATAEAEFWQAFMKVAESPVVSGQRGTLKLEAFSAQERITETGPLCQLSRGRISDAACAVVRGKFFVTLFRRVDEGEHPEEALSRALSETTFREHVPAVLGASRLVVGPKARRVMTLGLIHAYAPYEETLEDNISALWSRLHDEFSLPSTINASIRPSASGVLSEDAQNTLSTLLSRCSLLGNRLGELHMALLDLSQSPDLVPEPMTVHYRRSIYEAKRAALALALEQARARLRESALEDQLLWQRLIDREVQLQQTLTAVLRLPLNLMLIRPHGALSLNSILWTGNDIIFLGVGGERHRPLAERRLKRLAFRDLSRALIAFREVILATEQQKELGSLETCQQAFITSCIEDADSSFLEGYRSSMTSKSLAPADAVLFKDALSAFRISTGISQFSNAQLRGDANATRIALLTLLS